MALISLMHTLKSLSESEGNQLNGYTKSLLILEFYDLDNKDPKGAYGIADPTRSRDILGGAIVLVASRISCLAAWEGVRR